MKKFLSKKSEYRISIWALVVSGFSLASSILIGWFNYDQSNKAIDISQRALESQGPIIALAEEEMRKQSPGQYSFSFPFKNVGGRTAGKFKTNFCFLGLAQNTLVKFHSKHEPANSLAPNSIRYFSGSLIINPDPHFVVVSLNYQDDLVEKSIEETFFYAIDQAQGNVISGLNDSEIEQYIKSILPCDK